MYARNSKSVKVEPLLLKSLLQVARASAGSSMFRRYYCRVNGKETEVMRDGNLSCAFHISSLLRIFGLVRDTHITVNRLLDDMLASGWKKTKELQPGNVIVWEAKGADPKRMKKDKNVYYPRVRHAGIYLGSGKAVSNRSEVMGNGKALRVPMIHSATHAPIEMILRHPKLKR